MTEFPNGFPDTKSLYIKKNNGGVGPLYWTQAQSPKIGETREEYFHRLVYNRNLRFGLKEAEEISTDFCKYHNRMGEESGQDYVVLGWKK